MLIRFGLAHVLAALGGLVVAAGGIALAAALTKRLAPKVRDWIFGKALWIFLILGAATPFAAFIGLPTVWVVEDGPGRALAYRRYKLWGASATVETAAGAVRIGTGIDPERGPQEGEIDVVVNGTSSTLVVETVRYGGITFDRPPQTDLAPREWRRERLLNGVGDPPETMRVNEKSGRTGSMTWVRRRA